jgi:hypothetical protein
MLIISKFALDILLNEHFLDRISMTNKSEHLMIAKSGLIEEFISNILQRGEQNRTIMTILL